MSVNRSTYWADTCQPAAVFVQPTVVAVALSEMFLITALTIAMVGVPVVIATAVSVDRGGFDVNAAWPGVPTAMTKPAVANIVRYFLMSFMCVSSFSLMSAICIRNRS